MVMIPVGWTYSLVILPNPSVRFMTSTSVVPGESDAKSSISLLPVICWLVHFRMLVS